MPWLNVGVPPTFNVCLSSCVSSSLESTEGQPTATKTDVIIDYVDLHSVTAYISIHERYSFTVYSRPSVRNGYKKLVIFSGKICSWSVVPVKLEFRPTYSIIPYTWHTTRHKQLSCCLVITYPFSGPCCAISHMWRWAHHWSIAECPDWVQSIHQ